jgi:hypothetical protein
MTRPHTESSPDNLFDAIAQLLEPGQREYFYQRMLYFRHLRSEDELLRIVEALGFLALIIREAPKAVAIEREQLATILASSIASIQATAQAGQAYHTLLEDRLTRLPKEILTGISPEAIARAIIESVRQQFVHSGLPATAEALTVVSHQLNKATGDMQRAAGQLADCTDIADWARIAIDDITASLNDATNTSSWAATEVLRHFKVDYNWSLGMFCGGALLLGMLLEFCVQSCTLSRSQPVPPSAAPTIQTVVPAPPPNPSPKKTTR